MSVKLSASTKHFYAFLQSYKRCAFRDDESSPANRCFNRSGQSLDELKISPRVRSKIGCTIAPILLVSQ